MAYIRYNATASLVLSLPEYLRSVKECVVADGLARVNMTLRRGQALISFTEQHSESSDAVVNMDVTDLLLSDIVINITHIFYGRRGESLYLPGKLSLHIVVLLRV